MHYRTLKCRFPGIIVELTEITLRFLNWNYTVVPLYSKTINTYGKRQADGTYSSYLHYLQNGTVDMIIGDFVMSTERMEDFELLKTSM